MGRRKMVNDMKRAENRVYYLIVDYANFEYGEKYDLKARNYHDAMNEALPIVQAAFAATPRAAIVKLWVACSTCSNRIRAVWLREYGRVYPKRNPRKSRRK